VSYNNNTQQYTITSPNEDNNVTFSYLSLERLVLREEALKEAIKWVKFKLKK